MGLFRRQYSWHTMTYGFISLTWQMTHKVWVYFLKNKSDIFMTFKKQKNHVEQESGCNLNAYCHIMVETTRARIQDVQFKE